MSAWSPTAEGFRAMFRRPALSLAEVSWRWSFGAAACVLFSLSFIAYLDTLPVTHTDMLFLRTRHPVLMAKAVSHIFHGSALRVVLAGIVLFSALALVWILLASLGRGATLLPLLEHIRQRASQFAHAPSRATPANASEAVSTETADTWRFRSLAGLNFLRAALTFAAGAAVLGAVILAGFVSTKSHPQPGLGFLVAAIAIVLLWVIWSSINWFLSIASIFVVRQGEDTFAALSTAINLCRERLGPVVAVGTWFGFAHLVLFLIATSVVAFPFAFFPLVPLGVVLISVFLLTLLYFAFVDTLHIGRLAGYVAILEEPPIPPAPAVPIPPASPSTEHPNLSPGIVMVDQDELILSDMPITAEEHPSQIRQLEMQPQHPATVDGSQKEQGEVEPGKTTPDEHPNPSS